MVAAPAKFARRLLLVACDFDASASPQGLRWVRLSRALATLGWSVDVVTWAVGPGGQPSETANLRIHRVPPGPYRALLAWARQRRVARIAGLAASPTESGTGDVRRQHRLNWKGRLDQALRAAARLLMYPDISREGLPQLRARVRALLAEGDHSAVVLSHEPPLSLELLPLALASGLPVIADLGDPVSAPYTPRRWRRRALRLERQVCSAASAVVATSQATLDLLRRRHGLLPVPSRVIPQGFSAVTNPSRPHVHGRTLRLVYTGRFYRFRDPRALFAAVQQTADVRLALAVPDVPHWLAGTWEDDARFDMHGHLDHARAVELQATADVLVVLGNDDPTQTPGKLFEYFALPVPILYVTRNAEDPAARLVQSLDRGIVVPADGQAIAEVLADLRNARNAGELQRRFDLSRERVAEFSWDALAARYAGLLEQLVSDPM